MSGRTGGSFGFIGRVSSSDSKSVLARAGDKQTAPPGGQPIGLSVPQLSENTNVPPRVGTEPDKSNHKERWWMNSNERNIGQSSNVQTNNTQEGAATYNPYHQNKISSSASPPNSYNVNHINPYSPSPSAFSNHDTSKTLPPSRRGNRRDISREASAEEGGRNFDTGGGGQYQQNQGPAGHHGGGNYNSNYNSKPHSGPSSSQSGFSGGSQNSSRHPRGGDETKSRWNFCDKIYVNEATFPSDVRPASVLIGVKGRNHARLQNESGCYVQLRGRGISPPNTSGGEEPIHLWVKYNDVKQLRSLKEVLDAIIHHCEPTPADSLKKQRGGYERLLNVYGYNSKCQSPPNTSIYPTADLGAHETILSLPHLSDVKDIGVLGGVGEYGIVESPLAPPIFFPGDEGLMDGKLGGPRALGQGGGSKSGSTNVNIGSVGTGNANTVHGLGGTAPAPYSTPHVSQAGSSFSDNPTGGQMMPLLPLDTSMKLNEISIEAEVEALFCLKMLINKRKIPVSSINKEFLSFFGSELDLRRIEIPSFNIFTGDKLTDFIASSPHILTIEADPLVAGERLVSVCVPYWVRSKSDLREVHRQFRLAQLSISGAGADNVGNAEGGATETAVPTRVSAFTQDYNSTNDTGPTAGSTHPSNSKTNLQRSLSQISSVGAIPVPLAQENKGSESIYDANKCSSGRLDIPATALCVLVQGVHRMVNELGTCFVKDVETHFLNRWSFPLCVSVFNFENILSFFSALSDVFSLCGSGDLMTVVAVPNPDFKNIPSSSRLLSRFDSPVPLHRACEQIAPVLSPSSPDVKLASQLSSFQLAPLVPSADRRGNPPNHQLDHQLNILPPAPPNGDNPQQSLLKLISEMQNQIKFSTFNDNTGPIYAPLNSNNPPTPYNNLPAMYNSIHSHMSNKNSLNNSLNNRFTTPVSGSPSPPPPYSNLGCLPTGFGGLEPIQKNDCIDKPSVASENMSQTRNESGMQKPD